MNFEKKKKKFPVVQGWIATGDQGVIPQRFMNLLSELYAIIFSSHCETPNHFEPQFYA